MATAKQWTAPGPGRWEQDPAHQSVPFSHYGMRMLERHFSPGFAEACERYGLLMRTLTFADVDGWFYCQPEFVTDEEGVQRAEAAATEALATEAWRRDAERWFASEREALRTRMLALQRVNLGDLDNDALAGHLVAVEAALADGCRIHFRNAVAHWMGIGRWAAFVTGCVDIDPRQVLRALQGASPTSLDTLAYVDRLADAVKVSPEAQRALDAGLDDRETVAALSRSSVEVANALDAYLQEHGSRTFTGFDLLDQTTLEAPGPLLGNIRARLSTTSPPPDGQAARADLRARVPETLRAEHDALFESARLLYGLRDNDVGITYHWPMGLLRLALLEAGRRLHHAGTLTDPTLIFEATPEETEALLRGRRGVEPPELAERARRRLDPANAAPLPALGDDPEEPPALDGFPPAIKQVMGAFLMAQSLENVPPVEQNHALTIKGMAAAPGTYEGRACVVTGPSDFHHIQPGDVLVAPFTTPAYNVVLPMLGAVVTNHGGVLSHAAIVAREYGMPAVVATGSGTTRIPHGARVRVDGAGGLVTIVTATLPQG